MKRNGRAYRTVVVLLLALGGACWAIGPDWRALLLHPPLGRDVLFFSVEQRDAAFRMLDRIPFISEVNDIAPGSRPRELEAGPPLALSLNLDEFAKSQRLAGLVILHNGAIRLERYGLGFERGKRWTSFSVAKSITALLVGAALQDGAITSMTDPLTKYLPELADSAYDEVTVEQLLTMTSGVNWNEDYENPNSDVARFDRHEPSAGQSAILSYMRTLDRAHPPGKVWNYSTGETNLIGVLISTATGTPLARYLAEKIWQPAGMTHKATWLLGADGHEISGCCIQATTRDFARFGQFVLDARAGAGPFPPGWITQATSQQVDFIVPGQGYGYQWWTYDDGSFQADGIFGQGIFIDPQRQLVIASNGNWLTATGERDGEWEARRRFYQAVQAAVDRE